MAEPFPRAHKTMRIFHINNCLLLFKNLKGTALIYLAPVAVCRGSAADVRPGKGLFLPRIVLAVPGLGSVTPELAANAASCSNVCVCQKKTDQNTDFERVKTFLFRIFEV